MLPRRLISFKTCVVLAMTGVFLITIGYLCLTSSFFVPSKVQYIGQDYHSNVLSDQISREGGAININKATSVELESLPLVGPSTAQKIVKGRPYSTINELLTKKIVSQKVFDVIQTKIKS